MKNKISVKHKIVSEIMTSPVRPMTLSMTVKEAIQFLMVYKLSGAPLLDHNGQLLSIVSELDLMKIGALEGTETTLGEAKDSLPKRRDLITVKPDDAFVNMFRLFLEKNVRRVLVVDDKNFVVGIVARRDILKAYIDYDSGRT